MSVDASESGIRFCGEGSLNYASSRRRFGAGEALLFDEAYRLAHLPLVAPEHPAGIRQAPGQDYRDGRYGAPRYSLVLPVRSDELEASPAFRALERDLRSASFAPKIAWDLCARRASKLHATIVNGLTDANAERCASLVGAKLADLHPLRFRLGGPFVGSKNTGRIYFPVYPEERAGDDSFGLLQDAAGAVRTRFYLVGYYNLLDELDARETAELAGILEGRKSANLGTFDLSSLAIQVTNDDLVLSGRPVLIIDGRTGIVRKAGPRS